MKRIVSIILVFILISCSVVLTYGKEVDNTHTCDNIFVTSEYKLVYLNKNEVEIIQYIGSGTYAYTLKKLDDTPVISIGEKAFNACDNLETIEVSDLIRDIGDLAFSSCSKLSKVILKSNVEFIGNGAFNSCDNLKDVNLQDTTITNVSEYLFLNSGIEKVELPETCEEISSKAFMQCSKLSYVLIPKSVQTIANDAFTGSDKVVIYCYKDSAAEKYAIDNNIKYELLDKPETYLVGDTDGNNDVDILDATLIQKLIAHVEIDEDGKMSERGSYDNSGELIILDATKIQRSLAELPGAELIGTIREYK